MAVTLVVSGIGLLRIIYSVERFRFGDVVVFSTCDVRFGPLGDFMRRAGGLAHLENSVPGTPQSHLFPM